MYVKVVRVFFVASVFKWKKFAVAEILQFLSDTERWWAAEPDHVMLQGPFRHYVPNVLWTVVNVFCLALTFLQLRRLTLEVRQRRPAQRSQSSFERMRMYWIMASVHASCWAPLYLHTTFWSSDRGGGERSVTHQVRWHWQGETAVSVMKVVLHLALSHSFVNPLLHLLLRTQLRTTITSQFFCQDISDGRHENESKIGEIEILWIVTHIM